MDTYNVNYDSLYSYTEYMGSLMTPNSNNDIFTLYVDKERLNKQLEYIRAAMPNPEQMDTLGMSVPHVCYTTSAVAVEFAEGASAGGEHVNCVFLNVYADSIYVQVMFKNCPDVVDFDLGDVVSLK